ncbi:MAG: hypothetical protein V3V97_07820 [Hyphomicrobiaceae bacterium]
MRLFAFVVCVLLAALIVAVPDKTESRLIVFDGSGCRECTQLREYVVRPYLASKARNQVPMEIVDIASLGTSGHALRAPIRTLPTIVIVQDGREVARMAGYSGPDRFYDFLATSLGAKRAGTEFHFD